MNTIATFRKCTLTDEELLRAVDKKTDDIFKQGKIPSRCIPARPNEDYDLLVGELILRYEAITKQLNKPLVMQAESACAKCGGTEIIKGGPTDSRKDSPCDCAEGAAVDNSAAGQSGSRGIRKWCDSCGKITTWIDGDCENYKTRGGSDKGALLRRAGNGAQ